MDTKAFQIAVVADMDNPSTDTAPSHQMDVDILWDPTSTISSNIIPRVHKRFRETDEDSPGLVISNASRSRILHEERLTQQDQTIRDLQLQIQQLQSAMAELTRVKEQQIYTLRRQLVEKVADLQGKIQRDKEGQAEDKYQAEHQLRAWDNEQRSHQRTRSDLESAKQQLEQEIMNHRFHKTAVRALLVVLGRQVAGKDSECDFRQSALTMRHTEYLDRLLIDKERLIKRLEISKLALEDDAKAWKDMAIKEKAAFESAEKSYKENLSIETDFRKTQGEELRIVETERDEQQKVLQSLELENDKSAKEIRRLKQTTEVLEQRVADCSCPSLRSQTAQQGRRIEELLQQLAKKRGHEELEPNSDAILNMNVNELSNWQARCEKVEAELATVTSERDETRLELQKAIDNNQTTLQKLRFEGDAAIDQASQEQAQRIEELLQQPAMKGGREELEPDNDAILNTNVNELSNWQARCEKVEAELATVTSERDETRLELQKAINDSQANLQKLRFEGDAIDQARQEHERKLTEHLQIVEDLRTEKAQTENQYQAMQRQAQALQEHVDKLTNQSLNTSKTECQARCDEVEAKLATVTSERDETRLELQKAINDSQANLQKLRFEGDAIDQARQEHERKLTEHLQIVEDLRTEKAQTENQYQAMQRQAQALQDSLDESQTGWERRCDEIGAALKTVTNERDAISQQLITVQDASEKTIADLRNDLAQCEAKLETASRQWNDAPCVDNPELNARFESYIQKSRDALNTCQAKLMTVTTDLSKAKTDAAHYRQRLESLLEGTSTQAKSTSAPLSNNDDSPQTLQKNLRFDALLTEACAELETFNIESVASSESGPGPLDDDDDVQMGVGDSNVTLPPSLTPPSHSTVPQVKPRATARGRGKKAVPQAYSESTGLGPQDDGDDVQMGVGDSNVTLPPPLAPPSRSTVPQVKPRAARKTQATDMKAVSKADAPRRSKRDTSANVSSSSSTPSVSTGRSAVVSKPRGILHPPHLSPPSDSSARQSGPRLILRPPQGPPSSVIPSPEPGSSRDTNPLRLRGGAILPGAAQHLGHSMYLVRLQGRVSRDGEESGGGVLRLRGGSRRDGEVFENDLADIRNEVVGLRQDVDDLSADVYHPHTPERRKILVRRSFPFRVPATRATRSHSRNQMMSALRKLMQETYGIETDDEFPIIIRQNPGFLASFEDVENFLADDSSGPTLECAQVYLEHPRHSWNRELATLFAEYISQQNPHIDFEPGSVIEHFIRRLDTWRKLCDNFDHLDVHDNWDHDETLLQFRMMRKREVQEIRRRTRQRNLYHLRRDLCKDNIHDEAWHAMFEVVDALDVDGQSSDESDDERHVFRVKVQTWRNPEVTTLLRFIDEHRPSHSHLGNRRPGAPPRDRWICREESGRPYEKVPAGLPANLYNPAWYHTLNMHLQTSLGVNDPIGLPSVSDDDNN
ncbi:hypothetical protein H0H93_008470 [Arthromyces matolae]|nr:hypothetical protein H0H93_008470 [Arthromyces matolae]